MAAEFSRETRVLCRVVGDIIQEKVDELRAEMCAAQIATADRTIDLMEQLVKALGQREKRTVVITHEDGSESIISER